MSIITSAPEKCKKNAIVKKKQVKGQLPLILLISKKFILPLLQLLFRYKNHTLDIRGEAF
jgi:hypothetical protein